MKLGITKESIWHLCFGVLVTLISIFCSIHLFVNFMNSFLFAPE